jgi:hypothetical protein
MTENMSFWDEHTPDIRREFSSLQLHISQAHFSEVRVNADILFMAWKVADEGDLNAQAEQWGCAHGVSVMEARRVKDVFWKQRTKFSRREWWNVKCLCTAETALWDDSPTDVLDHSGMWFDDVSMAPPSRAAWD